MLVKSLQKSIQAPTNKTPRSPNSDPPIMEDNIYLKTLVFQFKTYRNSTKEKNRLLLRKAWWLRRSIYNIINLLSNEKNSKYLTFSWHNMFTLTPWTINIVQCEVFWITQYFPYQKPLYFPCRGEIPLKTTKWYRISEDRQENDRLLWK